MERNNVTFKQNSIFKDSFSSFAIPPLKVASFEITGSKEN